VRLGSHAHRRGDIQRETDQRELRRSRGREYNPTNMAAVEAKTIDTKVEQEEAGKGGRPETAASMAATAYDADRPPVPAGAITFDPLIGKRIDHFEIRALLGEGGMGTVYLAHDLSLERPVAIKVLRRELADKPDLVSRLVLEARAQARLQHPNVVNVYYIGSFEGAPYFAMEYVRGQTLAELLQRNGPLRWEEALEHIIQTTRALMEANHRGIVHRDVKPSNIILVEMAPQTAAVSHIKVADFGLAAPPGIREEHFVGSPFYASPEQISGRAPDHRSDMYSLGVTFHELITGAPPFQADSLGEISKLHQLAPRPAIPPRQAPWKLRQLITEMMDPEPTKRPWTYEELCARLEALRPRPLLPGGLVARGMALVLDLGLFAAVGPLLAGAFALSQRVAHQVAFLLFGVYYVLSHRFAGQTLGKRLFGLRIQGTTRQVSLLGMTLRFATEFWSPIATLIMIDFQIGSSPNATNLAAVKEQITDLVGMDQIPVFDAGTEELLRALWVPNLVLAFIWMAGFLFAAFDDNRRALHDRLARTRVIYSIREERRQEGVG
jgi:uncharacterized RDD family membrane protein YckC